MRLVLALIYLGLGAWAYIEFSGWLGAARFPVGLAVGFALLFSSEFLFNKGLVRRLKRQPWADYLGELESKGKLIRERYAATRALHCEDLSTGCTVYFIDVGQKGTVLLYGQDYHYEPLEDDDEPLRPREFPACGFSILRKAGDPEVLGIEMAGDVFEPEEFGEPEPSVLYELGLKFSDGLVFQRPSYDSIRSSLIAASNPSNRSRFAARLKFRG